MYVKPEAEPDVIAAAVKFTTAGLQTASGSVTFSSEELTSTTTLSVHVVIPSVTVTLYVVLTVGFTRL